jgi:hemerythrin-like metal-binding protein
MIHNQMNNHLLGIPEIDNEHIELYKILVNFKNAISIKDFTEAERFKGEFFVKLAQHLSHEEQLMLKISYPYLAEHAQKHASLENKFETTPVSNMTNYSSLAVENELFSHIDWDDAQIVPYYKQYIRTHPIN